jgi:ABC-2 type transport system permease protein
MISWRRTRAIARKETYHVVRDVRSLLLALALPLFLLLLFGYALTLDVDRVPVIVHDMDRTPQSRELIERFRGSRFFQIRAVAREYADIESSIDRGECLMALVVPKGYAQDLLAGRDTEVQIILDGSDSNTASIAQGYATALLQAFDMELRNAALRSQGLPSVRAPVEGQLRVWYNPELLARYYLVPGLIALIMMIIGALLTSLTIAREYETGTMEQLLSTPVRPVELVLGKIVPYYVIGIIDMTIAVLAGTLIFNVPLRGSALVLFGSSAVFMLGTLSIGMFISAATKSQTMAFQFGILTSFLPAFMLSGFIYSIENMPLVIQAVTYLVPARYFITMLKGVFLKGVGVQVLWVEGIMLIVFSVVMFRLAVSKVTRKLA